MLSDFQLRKTIAAGALAVNDRKYKKTSALTVQCFDTFCGFLHKRNAATMDGKGRGDTLFFSHDYWEGSRGRGSLGTGGSCPPATPLAPPMQKSVCSVIQRRPTGKRPPPSLNPDPTSFSPPLSIFKIRIFHFSPCLSANCPLFPFHIHV